MGDFFKGWRRKAGLITLAMAIVLTAVWMRSFIIEDFVSIQHRHLDTFVFSSSGFVSWHRTLDRENNQSGHPVMFLSMDNPVYGKNHYDPWRGYSEIDWRRDCAGASFGVGIQQDFGGTRCHFKMWVIPYWMLVLPLTLLSAWLILTKPRKAKVATGSTP